MSLVEDSETGLRYARSPLTGSYYRVSEWVVQEDGRVLALDKTEIPREEIPADVVEDLDRRVDA